MSGIFEKQEDSRRSWWETIGISFKCLLERKGEIA